MILKIIFWVIVFYIVCYPLGRFLLYSAAILHNWCMRALYDGEYWFDKGTRIKDLFEEISEGENFQSGNEGKFIPIGNLLFPLIWLFGETLFFILVVIILSIKLIVCIIALLYQLIYVKCIAKLLRPLYRYLGSVNWQNTWVIKFIRLIITILIYIKNFILNFRIA